MDANYSLSDLATITGGNNFGNSSWLIILLLFLFLGGGTWGNRGELNQYATAASQQEILFNQKFDTLGQKVNQIGDGICSSTYALNNAIINEARATQTAVGQNRFDMANYNAGILAAISADGEKTRGLIQENKIEALQQQISQLQLQNALCGVVRYPTASTYTSGGNPFCGCNCGNI